MGTSTAQSQHRNTSSDNFCTILEYLYDYFQNPKILFNLLLSKSLICLLTQCNVSKIRPRQSAEWVPQTPTVQRLISSDVITGYRPSRYYLCHNRLTMHLKNLKVHSEIRLASKLIVKNVFAVYAGSQLLAPPRGTMCSCHHQWLTTWLHSRRTSN